MNFINLFLLALVTAAGCWINTFFGGILAGFCLSIFLFSIVGKHFANKNIKRINKSVRDIIINN